MTSWRFRIHKKVLATMYVEKVSALKDPEGTTGQLDATSAARLREAHGRFETATAANLRALATAAEAAKRTVGAVVDLARSALSGNEAAYGPRATKAPGLGAPAAISVNVTL